MLFFSSSLFEHLSKLTPVNFYGGITKNVCRFEFLCLGKDGILERTLC